MPEGPRGGAVLGWGCWRQLCGSGSQSYRSVFLGELQEGRCEDALGVR